MTRHPRSENVTRSIIYGRLGLRGEPASLGVPTLKANFSDNFKNFYPTGPGRNKELTWKLDKQRGEGEEIDHCDACKS